MVIPKTNCPIAAANFLDEEAELSESEWGSADEDEKDMDKFEMELGDEDEFDSNKIRSELEKIHMRRMLDQDAREIKKIQELLLEDEDAVGRDRKFVWKNVSGGDFGLQTDATTLNDGALADGDNESEEHWRKMRYEREKALNENDAVSDSSFVNILLASSTSMLIGNSSPSTLSAKKKKIFINKVTPKTKTPNDTEKSFLINSSRGITLAPAARGSFLSRDQETLKRFTAILSRQSSSEDGDALSAVPSKGNQYVFATMSPPVTAKTFKRKSEDENINLENRSKKLIKKSDGKSNRQLY